MVQNFVLHTIIFLENCPVNIQIIGEKVNRLVQKQFDIKANLKTTLAKNDKKHPNA